MYDIDEGRLYFNDHRMTTNTDDLDLDDRVEVPKRISEPPRGLAGLHFIIPCSQEANADL